GYTLPDAHCATYKFSSLSTQTSCGCMNIFSAWLMGCNTPSLQAGSLPPMLDTTLLCLSNIVVKPVPGCCKSGDISTAAYKCLSFITGRQTQAPGSLMISFNLPSKLKRLKQLRVRSVISNDGSLWRRSIT